MPTTHQDNIKRPQNTHNTPNVQKQAKQTNKHTTHYTQTNDNALHTNNKTTITTMYQVTQ